MRTSGGEIIPEAGIFVCIKKKVGSTWVLNASRKLSKQVGMDSISDDVLESIVEEPEEMDDIDVTKSINPIALRQRSSPRLSPMRFSSPPNLESSIEKYMNGSSPINSEESEPIVVADVSVAGGNVVITATKQRSATKVVESIPTSPPGQVLLSVEPTSPLTANGDHHEEIHGSVPEKEIFLRVEVHESDHDII